MYSTALATASYQGIMVSALAVAVALGAYFMLSHRADILGATVLVTLTAFVAKDYYHIVYVAGTFLGIALLMQLTDFDEGTFRGAIFYAGVGLFAATILYYLAPNTIRMNIDYSFILVLAIAAFFVLIEGLRTGFEYDSEALLAILGALAIVFIVYSIAGAHHATWGLGLMAFGVLMKLILGGFISVTSFVAGFMIWLDDVTGHALYGGSSEQSSTLFLAVGALLILVYAYLQWRD
ncbi:hypothetical protein [Thermococcus thioreducens]|uniref:Uncharacterized protein n=1 Tax=Thermococcus thioreducens TaxID=277988 RepID=A0A0Q2URH6_9EURY|nr:hypothetical protein [Thermococcus thioreducens]ASJ13361.1 hypothetical protein A3L14_10935 [Thermococcus thioreducens]KQH83232.1 hypothetical protein AMR53_00675 [Thermococcus thioreducens]SEW23216.1 hypothetical protein SAMN05216170_2293 [Thermococcus thioreducens]